LELGSRFDSKTRYQVHLSELKFPKSKNLSLADPSYYMLLGSDIYYELMLGEIYQGPVGYPLALNTRLGYNLSRNVCEREHTLSVASHTVKICKQEELDKLEELLPKFWELEQAGEGVYRLAREENWCEDIGICMFKYTKVTWIIVQFMFA